MGFQFLPALKALAPLVASAGGLGSWLVNRKADKGRSNEVRISELETAQEEQAGTLVQLTEQIRILTVHLQEKEQLLIKLKRMTVVSWTALVIAVAAAVLGSLAFFA